MGARIGDRGRSTTAAEEGDAAAALGNHGAGEGGDGQEAVGDWVVVDERGLLRRCHEIVDFESDRQNERQAVAGYGWDDCRRLRVPLGRILLCDDIDVGDHSVAW